MIQIQGIIHKMVNKFETHGRAYLRLSDFGNIVNAEWYRSFEIRTELFLDKYIMMTNHIHAILFLENNMIEKRDDIQTHGRASLPHTDKLPLHRLPKSISSFLAGFKSVANTKIDDYIDEHQLNIPKFNRNNHFFQPNYHDHIICNNESYERIKNYILNNPSNWKDDQFNQHHDEMVNVLMDSFK